MSTFVFVVYAIPLDIHNSTGLLRGDFLEKKVVIPCPLCHPVLSAEGRSAFGVRHGIQITLSISIVALDQISYLYKDFKESWHSVDVCDNPAICVACSFLLRGLLCIYSSFSCPEAGISKRKRSAVAAFMSLLVERFFIPVTLIQRKRIDFEVRKSLRMRRDFRASPACPPKLLVKEESAENSALSIDVTTQLVN